jgi:methylphosphotriester-DNA--protein-cysteine methyltransferase
VSLVGTKLGRAYHLSSCRLVRASWLMHKVTWSTPQEAVDAGRRPCRVCKPPQSQWGTYPGTFQPDDRYSTS